MTELVLKPQTFFELKALLMSQEPAATLDLRCSGSRSRGLLGSRVWPGGRQNVGSWHGEREPVF
jgi:hypothetical protein